MKKAFVIAMFLVSIQLQAQMRIGANEALTTAENFITQNTKQQVCRRHIHRYDKGTQPPILHETDRQALMDVGTLTTSIPESDRYTKKARISLSVNSLKALVYVTTCV